MLKPSDFNNAVPQFQNGNYASNPINPQYVEEPSSTDYNHGVEPLQTLPAQWWNWFVNKFTSRFNKVNIYVKNLFNELAQLLSLVNVTPDGTEGAVTDGQLKNAFKELYPDYINTKLALGSTYVKQTQKVNGHALSGDVTVTKGDVGLGNVVNTGDSATPTENGTTKFTTGGAYTELNKKVDKSSVTSSVTEGDTNPVTSGGVYNKMLMGLNYFGQTNDVKVDALTLTEGQSRIYTGSGVGYTGDIPNEYFRYGVFYVTRRSSNRIQVTALYGSSIACIGYNGSVWSNWGYYPESPSTDGNYALQCKVASGVPAFSWDMDTPTAVPSDATLHYSFDDVPDYPDGTAVERNLNGNTYNTTLSPNGTLTTDAYVAGDNKIHKSNVNGNANFKSDLIASYSRGVYRNINSLAGNILIVELLAKTDNLDIHIEYRETEGGTVRNSFPFGNSLAVGKHRLIFRIPTDYVSCTIVFYGKHNRGDYTEWELLNWYIGDGSYSTPIIDNSGDNVNAVNNGGVAVQGVCGKGVYFLNGKYANVASNFLFAPNFSISLWVKPDNNTNGLQGIILRNGQLLLRNGDSSSNFLMFILEGASSTLLNRQNIGSLLTPNVWTHLAIVRNGTSFSVYTNGVETYHTTLADSTISNTVDDLLISQNNLTRPQTIDDLLIFNRALSDDEVQAIYLNKANTPKFYNLNNYLLDNRSAVPAENGTDLFTTGGAYTLQQNINGRAPIDHASVLPIYGGASSSKYGHVKLGRTIQIRSTDSSDIEVIIEECPIILIATNQSGGRLHIISNTGGQVGYTICQSNANGTIAYNFTTGGVYQNYSSPTLYIITPSNQTFNGYLANV